MIDEYRPVVNPENRRGLCKAIRNSSSEIRMHNKTQHHKSNRAGGSEA